MHCSFFHFLILEGNFEGCYLLSPLFFLQNFLLFVHSKKKKKSTKDICNTYTYWAVVAHARGGLPWVQDQPGTTPALHKQNPISKSVCVEIDSFFHYGWKQTIFLKLDVSTFYLHTHTVYSEINL